MWCRGGIQSRQLKGILRTPRTVGEVDALLYSLYIRGKSEKAWHQGYSTEYLTQGKVKVIDLHAARAGLDFGWDLPNDLGLADTH